ncbi:MAG: hypothetical protein ABIN96_06100 [Rubrivivax sp.]
MWLHDTPLTSEPAPARPRAGRRPLVLLAATALRGASRLLDGLATALAREPTGLPRDAVVEFHAEAGAPEGALYVDGQLVGHVLGVKRL